LEDLAARAIIFQSLIFPEGHMSQKKNFKISAGAVGAVAIGSFAIGAVAIGELTVERLKVKELQMEENLKLPSAQQLNLREPVPGQHIAGFPGR
jgi:hypothetical protein